MLLLHNGQLFYENIKGWCLCSCWNCSLQIFSKGGRLSFVSDSHQSRFVIWRFNHNIQTFKTSPEFIYAGVNIYGHQYEAQQHSETTHNLPLPPNALGDKNLGNIYNDILNFIRGGNSNNYPSVYTHRDCVHIVESILDFLKTDIGANNIDLKVYPIQYLFYIMKEATCEAGELEKPNSFYITDAYFERDFFEYQIGIGCQVSENCILHAITVRAALWIWTKI